MRKETKVTELLCKLTDGQDRTRPGRSGETQWGAEVTHTASGKGSLCGPGWIHLYPHPLVAVFMDPTQSGYGPTAHLWSCRLTEGGLRRDDRGLKLGAIDYLIKAHFTPGEIIEKIKNALK